MGTRKGDLMTFHAFIEYFKYRMKAKSRHGVHSPFVYAFIEQGLLSAKGADLFQVISNYFKSYEILQINVDDISQCNAAIACAHDRTIIVLPGIHQDAERTQAWERLKRNSSVRISADMYKAGLLFFNTDIKEQQHFTLKYPL